MSKIVIGIGADNKMEVTMKGKVDYETLLNAMFTTTLSAMRQVVNNTPEEHREAVRGAVYDKFNFGASRVLEMFAPEYELHPGLTALAIKEAEDKIVMEGRLGQVQKGT